MDYKEIKRKEVLFEIIDDVTNGMDIYNHNGSLWIINTKELKWVVEFTNDKTLWYNYNLFKNLFKAISLDVSENQKYITEWFESKFLNVYTVKTTVDPFFDQDQYVEDTIQNGVKDTKEFKWLQIDDVEDTIQNGVKRTVPESIADSFAIEDTIQNGVKETIELMNELPNRVKKIIKKGVKDTIQNGVKETQFNDNENKSWVEGVIKGGVKETKTPGNGDIVSTVEWMKENNSNSYPKMIDDVNIDNIHEHINSENEQHHLNALIKWVLN